MVLRYLPLHDLDIFRTANLPDQLSHPQLELPAQSRLAILRRPHQVQMDLEDRMPHIESGRPVDRLSEPSHFFRLSVYQEPLLRWYREDPDCISGLGFDSDDEGFYEDPWPAIMRLVGKDVLLSPDAEVPPGTVVS